LAINEFAGLKLSNGFVVTSASLGEVFTVTETGPLRFDIPLDPESELIVTKAADRSTADVGDYINYTVTIQNSGTASAPIRLFDTLPIGFRYVQGTSRVEAVPSKDPFVSDDATLLTFEMDNLAPGETVNRAGQSHITRRFTTLDEHNYWPCDRTKLRR